jgi:hypothetical protein
MQNNDTPAEGKDSAQTESESALRGAACSAGWLPINSAPKDGTEIIVYCPPAHGLNHMASVCAYHEDAGFCVCELREPTLWIPLPNVKDQLPRP